jgi:hypothetical protein
MTSYVSPYTGQTLNPSQVGYENLTLTTTYTTLAWPVNGTTGVVVANIIEATANVSPAYLVLPSAQAVSVGQAFIIRNIGSTNAFTVVSQNSDGTYNTIQTVPVAPTTATVNTYYIYLTDNSTTQGTWSIVAMGIGTSAASASALAGYGLQALNTTLNTNTSVSLVSSAYTFNANDSASLYVWTGGAGTLTLPPVASVPNGYYVIVKNDGAGIVNVAAQGSSTIDTTSSTVQLQIANSSVFVSNGTNWYTYALAQQNTFNYTQLYLSLTGAAATVTLTSAQAKNVIQQYAGVLSQNTTIIVPQTVQLYSIRNSTSGAYTLTISTGVTGGTTYQVSSGTAALLVCDGTNVFSATSSSTSFTTQLTLGNGSATNPSLNFSGDTTTGLYLAASGQLGFAIAGTSAGTLTASGLLLPVGVQGGTF